MLSPEQLQIAAVALGALAFAGLVYALAFPYVSGEKQAEKRLQSVTDTKGRTSRARIASSAGDQASNRKKAVADTLKELEERQKAKEKISLRLRLQRAGLDITPNVFWVASLICGVVTAGLLFVLMPTAPLIGLAAAAFVGAFGLPRWIIQKMTTRRQVKFVDEFANAIDVIVRGVKSGLPLNECLGIIARESPQPISGEFQELVEQQRVGVPLSECFDRMMQRTPLPEVKFFAIVISIQQQAGGNLSEALGNLSGVLRDRKRLQGKVRALSAEAKASAAVLGALPFIVMIMVYLSTPHYISILWTTKFGQFLLACAAIWMTFGVLTMKKMINFKY
jgi:tight adherence protein B